MNLLKKQENRQILPRWVLTSNLWRTLPADSMPGINTQLLLSTEGFSRKRRDWRGNRSLPFAVDFVSSADAIGVEADTDIVEAAKLILETSQPLPRVLVASAQALAESEAISPRLAFESYDSSSLRQRLHDLRSRWQAYPRDPFLCLDLALYHVLLNQDKKAEKYIRIALILAGDDPFVLRTAARFYLHISHDPGRSLHLLRTNPGTQQNPLLLAAEVSIAEAFGEETKNHRRAQKILKARRFEPPLISELAGVVGTFEARRDARRDARRAFAIAAEAPNENILAQFHWISENLSLPERLLADGSTVESFEADTMRHFSDDEFGDALQSARKWVEYQPFSSRPAMIASYIASVPREDFDISKELLKRALIAAPNSFGLLNNLAFTLASAGQAEDARNVQSKINTSPLDGLETAVSAATSGLIAFRSGMADVGRNWYREAAAAFEQLHDGERNALALLFWAREEQLAETEIADEVSSRALNHPQAHKFLRYAVHGHVQRGMDSSR